MDEEEEEIAAQVADLFGIDAKRQRELLASVEG
jgi:hypothetical protein